MAIPIAGLITGMALIPIISVFYPPLQNWNNRVTYKQWQTVIPSIPELIDLYIKGELSEELLQEFIKENGLDVGWIELLVNAQRNILSISDSIAAYRRKIIEREELENNCVRLGYRKEDVDKLLLVSMYYPNPSDLIRFAVREVYSPEIAKKFGQYEDFPESFASEADKIGMNTETAKQYWAAHWELPSYTQGTEMYHRGIISEDELVMLLRSLDVMPFWRDKMIQLSYSPLARVDVRRMFRLGVLSGEELEQSYRNIGYSPEDAKKMAEFTVKYETDDTTGLTRSSIIKSYKDDLIDRKQLEEYLRLLDYPQMVVDYWLTQADFEKKQDDMTIKVTEFTNRFRLGIISLQNLREELVKLDLPAYYVEKVITGEQLRISEKVKLPSKEDLLKWLENEVINEVTFVEKMSLLGYLEKDIISYLESYAIVSTKITRKYMTKDDYKRWLLRGIISQEYFIDIMREQGYDEKDITSMIRETKGG